MDAHEMTEAMHDLNVRLTSHEGVCAARYDNIHQNLGRLDKGMAGLNTTLLAVAGASVLQLITLFGYLLTR